MSKEFHVFTHSDIDYEQAFVFEVERHEKERLVEFKDLLMITSTKHGELRTRVQFHNMVQSILETEGGNIQNNSINVIVDMFKDLLPKEKQTEILDEVDDKKIRNMSVEELIKMSEYAVIFEKTKDNNEQDKGTAQKT